MKSINERHKDAWAGFRETVRDNSTKKEWYDFLASEADIKPAWLLGRSSLEADISAKDAEIERLRTGLEMAKHAMQEMSCRDVKCWFCYRLPSDAPNPLKGIVVPLSAEESPADIQTDGGVQSARYISETEPAPTLYTIEDLIRVFNEGVYVMYHALRSGGHVNLRVLEKTFKVAEFPILDSHEAMEFKSDLAEWVSDVQTGSE